MKKISGSLIDDLIIIKKPKEVGRLFNKSHFGKTNSESHLQLNLIEGIFLVEDEKLIVNKENQNLNFEELIKLASKYIDRFEIKYLAFKDLRKRGYAVKININEKFDFHLIKKESEKSSIEKLCFISVFSERDMINIKLLKLLTNFANNNNGSLWFSIVDEEGDITYYDVSETKLSGDVKNQKYSEFKGFLLENRVIVFDERIAKTLFKKEFFGKPFGNGLQLSMVEALYLFEKKLLKIPNDETSKELKISDIKNIIKKTQSDIEKRLIVYKDLKKNGLIIKTGFKFGAHFRTYTKKPDLTHAEYLVHVVPKDFESIWAEMSRAVRLAHSVNKEIVFAQVNDKDIVYIKFGRLRP